MNENIKKEYMDEFYKHESARLFKAIKFYEDIFKKDACSFLEDEIEEFLISRMSSSVTVLRTICSELRTYTNYCISRGLTVDGINHYNNIDTLTYERSIDKIAQASRYISPNQVDAILKQIINNPNGSSNPRDAFIVLSIYEGLGNRGENYENIIYLKKEDVFDDYILLKSGEKFTCSSRLVSFAREAAEVTEYLSSGDQKPCSYEVFFNYGYVINPTAKTLPLLNDPNKYAISMRKRYRKVCLEFLFTTIPTKSLAFSGLSYAIASRMKELKVDNFYDATKDHKVLEIKEHYGYGKWSVGRLFASIKPYLLRSISDLNQ